MDTILHLFWLGFIIALAGFIFYMVLYTVIIVVGLAVAGIIALFRWIAGGGDA